MNIQGRALAHERAQARKDGRRRRRVSTREIQVRISAGPGRINQ